MGIWTSVEGRIFVTLDKDLDARKREPLNNLIERALGKNWPWCGVDRDYKNGETFEEWRERDRQQWEIYKAACQERESGVKYMPEDDCPIRWNNEGCKFKMNGLKVYEISISGSLESAWWDGVSWFRERLEDLHDEGVRVEFAEIYTDCYPVSEEYKTSHIAHEQYLKYITNNKKQ